MSNKLLGAARPAEFRMAPFEKGKDVRLETSLALLQLGLIIIQVLSKRSLVLGSRLYFLDYKETLRLCFNGLPRTLSQTLVKIRLLGHSRVHIAH